MTGKSMSMSGKLPGPNPVAEALRRRIAEAGSIGFDAFMAAALYDSQDGYYAKEISRTGKHGDFFTSVSLGPIFGRLLAAQFAQMWEALGKPKDFTLVEQGANDGRLLDDILTAFEHDNFEYRPTAFLVEPLPKRRQAQEKTLQRWAPRVRWVSHEMDLPKFTGIFFANELLDAFPVQLLTRRDDDWYERRVGHDGEKFVFIETLLTDSARRRAAQALPISAECARFDTEICPSLAGWMRTMASKLQRGWMLLVDYGHPASARYHPARANGSLAAYCHHTRRENPLDAPGEQDLTTHVDFTAVAHAGEEAGLQLVGFTDQHHALAALVEKVFPPMAAAPLDPDAAKEMRALRQLLHPESMGTSFKFLAFSQGIATPLTTFRFARDTRSELFGR